MRTTASKLRSADRNFDPAGTILPPIRVTIFPRRPPIGGVILCHSLSGCKHFLGVPARETAFLGGACSQLGRLGPSGSSSGRWLLKTSPCGLAIAFFHRVGCVRVTQTTYRADRKPSEGGRGLTGTPDPGPAATRVAGPGLAPRRSVAHGHWPGCGSVPPKARSAVRSARSPPAGAAR